MRIFLFLLVAATAANCANNSNEGATAPSPKAATVAAIDTSGLSEAVFAAGCFWCVEGVYESVNGVAEVVSGYAGGDTKNPTYRQVGSGTTGHAEAVIVYYDSTIVDFPTLLKVYEASTDITQVNGQGPDRGSAYRSILFYRNEAEKDVIDNMLKTWKNSGKYGKPVAVEVKKLDKFWPAEDYHQDYIQHNPGNPYVQHESIPRVKRFQRVLPELVKPEKNRLKE